MHNVEFFAGIMCSLILILLTLVLSLGVTSMCFCTTCKTHQGEGIIFGSLLVDRSLVVTGDGSEIGDMSGGVIMRNLLGFLQYSAFCYFGGWYR